MRILLCLLGALLFACEPGEYQDPDFGYAEQGLRWEVYGGGWEPATGFGRNCRYLNGSTCMFPALQPLGDPWVITTSNATTGWPAGYGTNTAREAADAHWVGNTDIDWEFTPTSCTPQNPNCTSLHFVNSEGLAGNLNPSLDYPISTIARPVCQTSTNLIASAQWPGVSFKLCSRLVVFIDVGSFTGWVNGWTSSAGTKQAMMNRLYAHLYGWSIGRGGHHDVPLTTMYDTLQRGFTNMSLTDVDKCIVQGIRPDLNIAHSVWIDDSPGCELDD